MKKLISLLLGMVVLLAACGGLKGDIDGNKYRLEIGEGSSAADMVVKFDGDKVLMDGNKEVMKYEVSDNEIVLKEDEENGSKFTLYDLKERNGSYTGKARMMEDGVELPISLSVTMTKQ
ncbi:hypothetical protein [Macrococcus equi]|uniref:hypothetical protein n=1 Tax=Macrococcus equi TaxID=3395462 RepID=UPI0039BDC0A7